MILLVPIFLLGCLLALVVYYWKELSEGGYDYSRRWLLRWVSRGAVMPVAVWVVLNLGRMPLMPPLTRGIASARAGGNWGQALITQTWLAALVIGSFWAALTFGWFLSSLFKRAKNSDDLIIATLVWCPALLPLFWFFVYFFGWSASGFAALLWVWPFTQYSLMVADVAKPAPSYSRAIGKMKLGKYDEAELAIIGQLEECATDFDGWMMLAELYADHFHDVAEAEKTICELCEEPTTTLPQVSMALHRLADWQLKLRGDPVAARRVLEEIGARMPGTHLALMARQRINQLPASVAELNEQQKTRTIHMPALNENLGETTDSSARAMNREEAMALANQFVAQLKQDPNDTAAREKLARIFAEQMGQLNLAMEQLELLIGMPGQLSGKVPEWLALMAGWQIQHGGNGDEARKILERLIREFPQSPQAFAAQRRLSLMNVKVMGRRER